MSGITFVIKEIIIFAFISYFLLELVPSKEYRKYINLFFGISIIILVLNPIISFLGGNKDFYGMYNKIILKSEFTDMDNYFQEYNEKMYDDVVQEYKNEIISQITNIVESEQLACNGVDIELNYDYESENFLSIDSITVYVARKYNEDERIMEIVLGENENVESIQVINIKKTISQFYNVGVDNINIIK